MSTEVQKPVEAVAPVAESTSAAAAPVETETKPVEAAVEPKAEETPKVDAETPAVAAPVEEKKEEKPVEPIYSGALGYKAPGLKNIFRTSKKYFWFGEEAAVPASSLSQYLRGEKAEVAHPTVAWSSVTGKGLLFFVKHADQKETPAGVLNLVDATELSKDGPNAFHFKLHGDKHSFEASSTAERNGWFIALEKAITEAKASKEGIVTSEAYLDEKKKLDKPTLAPAAATTPKKSTEVAPKPVEEEAVAASAVAPAAATTTGEEAVIPTRAGSSSSSDEEKKKKASKSKSRSASRGKRASIFGSILGKKEKTEEKVEEKKEEKAEEKEAKKEEATPVTEASVAPVTAPVITNEVPPVEETKAEEAVAAPVTEEKKVEEKPKPTKRASIFGNFVEKLKSPTHEKKEPELTPVTKEPEVAAEAPKVDETPKVEEPAAPVVDVVDGTTEAPKKSEEVKPATTPAKEKQHFSFGKFLGGGKDKVKSPTTEKAPEAPKTEEAPKVEETPAPIAPVEPVEPVVPAVPAAEPTTEAAKEEPATEAAVAPAQKKRGSIFGLGGSVKKEKDGEEKPQGLKGLFRNASKAGKTTKKEKETTTPAKVDEAVEPTEEKTTEAAPVVAEEKTETAAAPASTEQATIGDVVPDAVTVGQAPKSTPAVTSSA